MKTLRKRRTMRAAGFRALNPFWKAKIMNSTAETGPTCEPATSFGINRKR